MMYNELAILAVFAFFFSGIAGGLERTAISGPIVFTVVGLVIGPLGLGWLQPDLDNRGLRMLADITLALVLFIAWFGPRGLASIVFAVIVLGNDLPGGQLMAMVVVCTVTLSILAHGISANPLARALGPGMER